MMKFTSISIVKKLLLLISVSFLFVGGVCAQDKPAQRPGYVLGSGDIVKIAVFQQPDMTMETRISENGTITFPLLGSVAIGGLTTSQAEAKIAEGLKAGGYIVKPQVTVIVSQFRSRQVSALGQVNKPGKFALEDATIRVTDLIALAGGITPLGGDIVTVIRHQDGKEVKTELDLSSMLKNANLDKNMELTDGDILFVPRAPMFFIYGEVQRPGSYRVEKGMTMMQAISIGGGLTQRGTQRGLRVNRRGADGKVQNIPVSLQDLVIENDVVYVKESLF